MSPRGLRSTLIATVAMTIFVGAMVGVGMLADALPAVVTAVVLVAFREVGRR